MLAVPATHGVWAAAQQVESRVLADDLAADAWTPLSAGAGSQGPRLYEWACFSLPYDAAPGMAHWLLVRRSLSDPTERAYYRVYGPAATTVEAMVRVAGRRWCIEVAFEEAKGLVGLDQYEVRGWTAWHRHITLALLAHAALVLARAGMDEPAMVGERGAARPT